MSHVSREKKEEGRQRRYWWLCPGARKEIRDPEVSESLLAIEATGPSTNTSILSPSLDTHWIPPSRRLWSRVQRYRGVDYYCYSVVEHGAYRHLFEQDASPWTCLQRIIRAADIIFMSATRAVMLIRCSRIYDEVHFRSQSHRTERLPEVRIVYINKWLLGWSEFRA